MQPHLPCSPLVTRLRSAGRAAGAAALASAIVGLVVVGGPVRTTAPTLKARSQPLDASALGGRNGRTVDLGLHADLVGFTWDGNTAGSLELRAQKDGSWSAWQRVDGDTADGPDRDTSEHKTRVGAGPVWLGHGVSRVQVRRLSGTMPALRMEAIDSEPGTTSAAGVHAAGAALVQPTIITRAGWGADESWRNQAPGCEGYPHYAKAVRDAYVHHTDTSNDYSPSDSAAIMRAIYYFHTHDRLWCDIAYNFLIDRYGQVFEGRYGGITTAVIGGAQAGFNTGSTSTALIGTFDTSAPPAAAYDALRRLLAWKLAYHGIDPTGRVTVLAREGSSSRYPAGTWVVVPTIVGHRDTNYTTCPGQLLYNLLPRLRTDVKASMPRVDTSFGYGDSGDYPLTGDWNGDGVATPGVYRDGWFYLRNELSSGVADIAFPFGDIGDIPVVGDWNGDGVDTVGVFRSGTWYLRPANTAGPAYVAAAFGRAGDAPVVGDWDGNATDTFGVMRGATWLITNALRGPVAATFDYGDAGDTPLAGRWSGAAAAGPGVFRDGRFYLRNTATTGVADITYRLSSGQGHPVVGDFDADGKTTAGLFQSGGWQLDRS